MTRRERYWITNKHINIAEPTAVSGTSNITKRDMKLNDLMPKIGVDQDTYEVKADGEVLTCEPATILPMAQRYFLF